MRGFLGLNADIDWNDGWMYAFGFADPSGHKWSPMYMDMSKYQK